jgi:muramidase (phage lysozyme)
MALQFGSLVDGLFSGAKSVNDLIESRNRMAINQRFAEAASKYYEAMAQPQQAPPVTVTPNADAGSSTPPEATAEAAPPEARKAIASMAVNTDIPSEGRALLDTISGPESGGVYNIRYTPSGGVTYTGDQHPRILEPVPNTKDKSSAAGRYQITGSTLDELQSKYGYTDFAPKTQDDAAWHLAQDTYKQKTGGDLLTDLRAGKTTDIEAALRGRWPTINLSPYGDNLAKYFRERTPESEFGGRNPRTAIPAIAPPTPDLAPPPKPTPTTAPGAGAGTTSAVQPPAGAPSAVAGAATDAVSNGKVLTQKEQEAARVAAGKPRAFPPNQKYNSRGEAIASDLKPIVPGAHFPRGSPPNSGGGFQSALDPGAGFDPEDLMPPPTLSGGAPRAVVNQSGLPPASGSFGVGSGPLIDVSRPSGGPPGFVYGGGWAPTRLTRATRGEPFNVDLFYRRNIPF